ncbi:MAG: hypothetical protein KA492_06700 [Bacteroidia bacterium]|nr:hypothetical protein [Bacteroidia bacterium]
MKINYKLFFCIACILIVGCKKDSEPDPVINSDLQETILSDISNHVVLATYNELRAKGVSLETMVGNFVASPTTGGLVSCRQAWKDMRQEWELSEGFLYGPVSYLDIDPSIDTWPVNFSSLDSLLASSVVIDSAGMESLEFSLKGFHPLEYMLFGLDGNKSVTDFTARQFEYCQALAQYLKSQSEKVYHTWNPDVTGNYLFEINHPGQSNSVYSSRRAVFIEIVNALVGICDEVANGKIEEPLVNQDPSLEESPYSGNSIVDFTNNLKSVENIYFGKYSGDHFGLNELVRAYNTSLDNRIQQQLTVSIVSLQAITMPFGEAIIQIPLQLQQVQANINALKETLEQELLPLVQLHGE